MSILGLLIVLAMGAMGMAVGCGGDGDGEPPPETPRTAAATGTITTPSPVSTPEVRTEFKVAFVNLLSPVALDTRNAEASDTFEERLDAVVEELSALEPDLVAFTEVSWTKANGSAAERLAKGLRMEFSYVRANPWYPGQTKEQSDQMARLAGFDEGEMVFSRYPILRTERLPLNPRTSETEARVVLHVVLKMPAPVGELDVYVTHLTGGGDKTRQEQAADLVAQVTKTRGEGAVLIMADLSDRAESPPYEAITGGGFVDMAPTLGGQPATTCCRATVLGQQPPATARHDFIFAADWRATSATIFGSVPGKRADGALLYASDHNGVFAVFPLAAAPP